MVKIHQIPAGDPNIYSSPDVYVPVTAPGTLEKPVHQDARGVIQRLNKHNLPWLNEIPATIELPNILYTKKGNTRSGDLHKGTQMDYIVSGKIELWTYQNGKTVKEVLGPHTFILLGPHTPHLFHFLEDTIMSEWWDEPFKAWFFKPYRDIIEGRAPITSIK